MKRSAATLVVLVCMAIMSAPVLAVSREPVKLSFANYWTDSRIPLVDAQLEEFHKLYPWITVENHVTTTSAANMEKVYLSIITGTPPDVWMVRRTQLPEYVEQGFLQPLDEFIKQDNFNMNIFYQSEAEMCRYQGKTYSLPVLTGGSSMLFYNRMLFTLGGMDPEKPPQTWDELLMMATRLQRVHPDGRVEIGGGDISAFAGFKLAQLASTFGANIFKGPFEFDYLSDRVHEAARWASEFAGRVPKGGAMAKNTLVFETGGEWRYFMLKQENPELDLGVGLLPHGATGESIYIFGGAWSYAIPKGAKNPYESWLLIKFLTTSEAAQNFLLEQGRPSPVIRFNQDRRYFAQNPYWHVVIEAMNRTVTYPPSPVTQQVISVDGRYYSQLLARKESPEAILTKLQDEIKVIIADYLTKK